eukprot:scaffold50088_cov49-Cyclotella_meneghiniana.AAC.4
MALSSIEISFAATAMALVSIDWLEFKLESFMMNTKNEDADRADGRRRRLSHVGTRYIPYAHINAVIVHCSVCLKPPLTKHCKTN